MNDDDHYPTLAIGRCKRFGPRLVSDRVRSYELESFPRRVTQVPRYRAGPLAPWRAQVEPSIRR